ncbi:MAG: hypothetical protein U1F43_21410 [Myxococcota bacterium]
MVSKAKNNTLPKGSGGTTSSTVESSSSKSKLRGLSFEDGEKQLAPVDAELKKPGTGARLTNANYAKLYDLYGKYLKAGPSKQSGLLAELDQAIQSWLTVHDGSKKHDKSRLPGVKLLADQVRVALSGGKTSEPETTKVESPKVESPKVEEPKVETPKVETPKVETPKVDETPKVVDSPKVDLVPPEEMTPDVQPPKDVPPPHDVPPPPKDLPPPITSEDKPPEKGDEPPKKEEVKENPVVAKLPDAKVELTVEELVTLDYNQILSYLDTREKTVVEKLRTADKFISHVESLGAEQLAQVVCRILLRTPDSVVNKGGSRTEAIRILSSQLRNAEVCKNLLSNEAFVVIIPKNKLMTDFAEFSQWAGTYTFDGRPWDITRGMGGIKTSRNTAIAEENLTGDEVDDSVARKGWHSKEWMEHSKSNGTTETNENGKVGPKTGDTGTKVFNAGVYCSGYSTTNHEFFHTIHSLGLNKTDHAKIQSEYDDKKKKPKETEWADGPQMPKDADTFSVNYASSTVFEYFAQTGCAFQGTNVGTDPYTSRDRNNGRSWVDKNEPELAKILSKVCSDSELKNVNPRDAKKKVDDAPKVEDVKPKEDEKPKGGTTSVVGGSTTTAPKKEATTPEGGTKVGDSVGLIGQK